MMGTGRLAASNVLCKTWPPLALLCLAGLSLLWGCATWPMHQPYQETPGQGIRPAWLAHGLMGNELHQHNLSSLNFLAEGGRIYPLILITRPSAHNASRFDLWIHQYRDAAKIEHLGEHWRQRLASPYLRPLAGSFEGQPCWFVLSACYQLTSQHGLDLGYMVTRKVSQPPTSAGQLEIYLQDPQAGFAFPWAIITAAPGDESFAAAVNYIFSISDRLYTVARIQRGADGGLVSVDIVAWSPPDPMQILAGYKTNAAPQILPDVSRALNQRLLEWKTKELAEALPGYGKAQLQDLVVKLESALLELDTHVKRVKEEQDEAARYLPQPGQAGQAPAKVPPWRVEQAHLFTQRKAIVMACLEMVKKTLAQKR